jgi:hypothetical protein
MLSYTSLVFAHLNIDMLHFVLVRIRDIDNAELLSKERQTPSHTYDSMMKKIRHSTIRRSFMTLNGRPFHELSNHQNINSTATDRARGEHQALHATFLFLSSASPFLISTLFACFRAFTRYRNLYQYDRLETKWSFVQTGKCGVQSFQ